VLLVNAYRMKQVPGRKTDLKDAQWIARLLRWGLLKPSLIPPKPIRELRDLCRYRKKLTEQTSAERNRVQKVLEDAKIKLASVATDIWKLRRGNYLPVSLPPAIRHEINKPNCQLRNNPSPVIGGYRLPSTRVPSLFYRGNSEEIVY